MESETGRGQQSHIGLPGLIVLDSRRSFLERRRRLTQSIAIGTTPDTAAAVVVDGRVEVVVMMMVPGRRRIVGRGDGWRLATAMFFVPLCMVLVLVLHHYVGCSGCCRQIDFTHFHGLLGRLVKSEKCHQIAMPWLGSKGGGGHTDIYFSGGGLIHSPRVTNSTCLCPWRSIQYPLPERERELASIFPPFNILGSTILFPSLPSRQQRRHLLPFLPLCGSL